MPGVHAYAGAGVAAIAMSATPTTHTSRTAGCRADSRPNLDTDPLPLATNCFAEIIHLGAYYVVDRLARTVDVLANGLRDFLSWKCVDQLFAAVARNAVTACRFITGPACTLASSVRSPSSAW